MELLNPPAVRALLAAHDLAPKKSLGQNFLVDPNTARRIVRLADVDDGDDVVEIGPGLGSLTLALLESGVRVTAVELDQHLAGVLGAVVAERAGDAAFRVVVGDAATVDWGAVLGGAPRWSCVSNLPYNVAASVVVRLLDEAPQVARLLVMVQREVGERLAAAPGDEQYGALSVRVAYRAEAAVVGRVPPAVFVPRPKVDSALVQLRRRPAPPVEVPSEDALFRLVRAGFGQRRKMLRRSLQPVLGERAGELLEAAGIAPSARAETLGLEEWAALARTAAAA
jgi:16S rRNA (adenine1518-N6/adenine1519-N6)-dimethyltransferase